MNHSPADVLKPADSPPIGTLAVLATLGHDTSDLEDRIRRTIARCKICLRRALRQTGGTRSAKAAHQQRLDRIRVQLAQAQWDLELLHTLRHVSGLGNTRLSAPTPST